VKVTTASGIAGPQSPSTRTLAPQYLLGLGEDALMDIAKGMGYPGFRGRQIHNALYDMRKASISDMSQLPVGLRTDLEAAGHETGRVAPLQVVAAPDGTKKVLLQLWCGSVIEAVGIPEEMEDTRAAANAAEGYPLYEDGDELLEGSDVEYGGVGGGGASGERDTKDIQVVYDDDDEYGGVGGGTSGERDEENMQVIVDLDEAEDDDGWVRLGKMKTQREQKAAGTRRSRKDKAVKARAQAAEEKAEERTTASTKLDHRRFTVCVSSQVGCAMRCSFCATGRQGFRRNLTSAEIVNQVLALEALFHRRATNVVFMGMGEPLLNLREVLRAHRCLNRDVGIGGRSFTISTVGVPNALSKLAAHRLQATLAVSLHAPDQATRERLVPSAKAYPMEALLADCKLYKETTGRRVTFEYTLLAGENDSPAQAKALAKLLRSHVGRGCHINLLPWNPVGGGDEAVVHARPSRSAVKRFTDALTLEKGITHTVRRTRGLEADAACGQLTGSFERKQPSTRATVSQGAGAGSSVLPAKPLDVVRYTHTAFT
jgi:23S rRNA (adenine(2503)-C(2))-methyltransferase